METARDSCQTAVHTGLGSVRKMPSSETGNLSTIILELTKVRSRWESFRARNASRHSARTSWNFESGWWLRNLLKSKIGCTGAEDVQAKTKLP